MLSSALSCFCPALIPPPPQPKAPLKLTSYLPYACGPPLSATAGPDPTGEPHPHRRAEGHCLCAVRAQPGLWRTGFFQKCPVAHVSIRWLGLVMAEPGPSPPSSLKSPQGTGHGKVKVTVVMELGLTHGPSYLVAGHCRPESELYAGT